MDTIFALASARGKAGVSVLRISGAGAWDAVSALCGGRLPEPRRAALRRLSWQGDILDDALVIVFAEGASFTGEPSAELQVHGSIAVVDAVMHALGQMPGLRLAEPGEFTRRALENGRLDLEQVEGLADLIEAETEAQRRQAQRSLSGALGRLAESWRRDLLQAAALIEATIDFADEDVPVDVTPEVTALLARVQADLSAQIAGFGAAERIREGFEVAIIGRPNVGKSTLLNALAGRDAAITSDIAGTTRDVIEVRMDLAGLAVTFLDTAGLREATDAVEAIGIARAQERARDADLRVFLITPGEDPTELAQVQPGDLMRIAKSDTPAAGGVSGKTGAGVPELLSEIGEILSQRASGAGLAVRLRQRQGIAAAAHALDRARAALDLGGAASEIVAEELRSAARALEILIGKIGVEDLLDTIFSSFCIGK